MSQKFFFVDFLHPGVTLGKKSNGISRIVIKSFFRAVFAFYFLPTRSTSIGVKIFLKQTPEVMLTCLLYIQLAPTFFLFIVPEMIQPQWKKINFMILEKQKISVFCISSACIRIATNTSCRFGISVPRALD